MCRDLQHVQWSAAGIGRRHVVEPGGSLVLIASKMARRRSGAGLTSVSWAGIVIAVGFGWSGPHLDRHKLQEPMEGTQ